MFWGLILEPRKRYSQKVDKPFHISMASLDVANAGDKIIQLMIVYEKRNYLLCSLQKDKICQVPLDLNFEEGMEISFLINGDGHVHLTGYIVADNEFDFDDESEEEEDETVEDEIPTLLGSKKRKASPIDKKLKKGKKEEVEEAEASDEEDSDVEMEGGSDEEIGYDSDEIVEGGDEDDNSDSSEDESDQEAEKPIAQPVSKKDKKHQNQQDKNKQMNGKVKQDKEKLINGKAPSQEKTQNKNQKKNKDKNKSDDKLTQGEKQPLQQQQQPKKRTIDGGVQVEDLKTGNGPVAKAGKFVTVYYVGRLKNGKKFDQTTAGEGFKFRLGSGEVIKGWDYGIAGMKVGGKRKLTIPPALGYGNKGSPPVIPANSQLHFEVELRAVH